MKRIVSYLTILASSLVLHAAAAPSTGSGVSNLVLNGDFESRKMSPWQIEGKQSGGDVSLDASCPHSGRGCLKATAGLEGQVIKTEKITTDINTLYTLSLWIKTDGMSKPDGVAVKILQRNGSTGWSSWFPTNADEKQSVETRVVKTGGTQDWKQYRVSFMPDATADSFEICLSLEPGMTGKAWFDDVTLGSVSTWIAQSDFTGQWHNVKLFGDQLRWVENPGATDQLETALQKGKYSFWLSQLGGNHSDIEVSIDGKVLGSGSGEAATGWRKLGTAAVSSGKHKITLTSRDPKGFKNKAAYAGMIISTDPETPLPDFNSRFNVPLETLPVTLYPAKPTDPRLVMVFSSVLHQVDYPELGAVGFSSSGASLIASIAHKHGVPVTWLVNNKSAIKMKDFLTKCHEEYGDEVASEEWQNLAPLKAALPWAKNTVAAAGGNRAVAAMENAGFQGAWGWCFEQVEIDNISDRGCHWGPFYVSRENTKMPASYDGKLVAWDWSVRDLNKALQIHAGEACRFSSDVDEPRRGHFMYGRAIEYWKQLLEEFQRNTDWNEMVPFMIQQESHEMESSFSWSKGSKPDPVKANSMVNLNAQALDEFFKYAKSKNVTFMTQPQFTEVFRKKFPRVTPAYHMLFRDIPTQDPSNFACPGAPITKGPYPLTFLYSGPDAQLAFEEGERAPKLAYNYQCKPKDFGKEKNIPQITAFTKTASGNGELWTITVSNTNPYDFPMGITEWGDFSAKTPSAQSENVKDCKVIGKTLLYVRGTACANSSSTFTVKVENSKK